MTRLLLGLLLLGGCLPELVEPVVPSRPDHDFDGDGLTEEDGDCDDEDASATTERAWFPDGDEDGYGAGTATVACHAPAGHAADGGDCRDTDPSVHPGADERCNDLDDDCDAAVDEDAVDATAWYLDADGDEHGAGEAVIACDPPADHVAVGDDCDDAAVAVHPGAEEPDCNDPVDYDCDGSTGQDDADGDGVVACTDCDDADADVTVPTWYADADEDGFGDAGAPREACEAPDGFVADATDCNDGHDAVFPGAIEACNGVDDDCDDLVDDDDPDVVGLATWYVDGDFDGYGSPGSTVEACDGPSGYAATDDDCDDADDAIHPNAPETDCADPVDYNCDGAIGYTDGDGDGVAACEDCDDADPAVLPGGTESCNGRDDDCDGAVDDGVTLTFYLDSDKDGYGSAVSSTEACSAPSGHVADATDCDDTRATVKPGGTETCNTRDDDCDGSVDEGVGSTFYADADGDGYGNASATTTACSAPSGYVAAGTDCDDTRGVVNPGAAEVCDGLDNDCDDLADDDDADVTGTTTFYVDGDDDGYGDGSSTVAACETPLGYAANDDDCDDANVAIHPGAPETDCTDTTDYNCDGVVGAVDIDGDGTFACEDCNDSNALVFPGATETCNGTDDDCDGTKDEGVTTTYWRDLDGDGYGNASSTTAACSRPSGYATNDDDCNDSSAAVSPSASEVCNGIDDDCDTLPDDGVLNTYYRDADGDGYGNPTLTTMGCSAPSGWVADKRDCNDGDANVNPGKPEVCNGKDDDCDSTVDEGVTKTYYRDADGDGFGTSATTTTGCSAPSGYVTSSTDCNDGDALIKPGGTEVCNGKNDDCDGSTDEGVTKTFYVDGDGDGYGDGAATTGCSKPSGFAFLSGDCDDADAAINPGALEVCDDGDTDEDCNGSADDADVGVDWSTKSTWYADADGDGYGAAGLSLAACDASSGWVANDEDCDDTDDNAWPGHYCFVGGTVGLGSADAEILGAMVGDKLGGAIARVPDCNGDGEEDVLLGATVAHSTAAWDVGAAYLIAGTVTGTQTVTSVDTAALVGTASGDAFGASVGHVTDVNLDGVDELLVGAPGYDDVTTAVSGVGLAVLYRCSVSGEVPITAGAARFVGTQNSQSVGSAVAGISDVTGDGVPDAALGSTGWTPTIGGTVRYQAGAVWLVDGGTSLGSVSSMVQLPSTSAAIHGRFEGTQNEERAGAALASADLDGDSDAELLIGAPGAPNVGGTELSGAVYVVKGPLGSGTMSLPSIADGRWATDYEGDEVGTGIATGEIDGDGYADVVVATELRNAAYLVYGGSGAIGSIDLSSSADAEFGGGAMMGYSVATLDVDGDGLDEVLVGDPRASGSYSDAGAVYLYFAPAGALGPADASAVFEGKAASHQVGIAVGASDLDADGWDDVFIGAPSVGSSAGAVYVLYGVGL